MKKIDLRFIVLIVLILLSGWIGRFIDYGMETSDKPGMMVWLGLPFVLVIFIRSFTKKGWSNSGLKPDFKTNINDYVDSIILFPILVFIVVQLARFSKAAWFYCPLLSENGGYPGLIAMLIVSGLLKNIAEESVWRGYFTAKFNKLGMSRISNHIITGIIWGLWHIPYIGFVLSYIDENPISLIPRFILGTIAFSIVSGELRLRTGSVLPAILLHTSAGVAIGLVYGNNPILEFRKLQWLFSPGIEGMLMIIFMLGIGVSLLLKKKTRR